MSRKTRKSRTYQRPSINRFARSKERREAERGMRPLSSFRLLTQQPHVLFSRRRVKRITKGYAISSPGGSPFLKRQLPTPFSEVLDVEKICRSRKERREVIFALKKQGGGHKPARYSNKSLVRC